MFPYNDDTLVNIQDTFVRQFIADVMFEIGAIYRQDDKFWVDWDSINLNDYNILVNIALECKEKCRPLYFSTSELCQAGRLFAYYILGKENKKSDEHINSKDLKVLYSLFLAFSPINISYKVFGGVVIE